MASQRFRTKLCRNYALGHCPQGDRCKYLHSNNIPTSPTFSVQQPIISFSPMNQPMSPTHSFPTAPVPMAYPWSIQPPTVYNPQPVQMNWTYSPPRPPQVSQGGGDSNSNPPQFRPLSWRTSLCRHYIKNQGWCPLGEDCGYIHDLALSAHATDDIRFPDGSHLKSKGNDSNGSHSRAGSKHSHCWAYVQGLCRVKDCPYLHPVAIDLFVPHTPCLAWPNCSRGALCAYKHPEPLMPRIPDMPPPMPSQVYPQPPSPIRIIPTGTLQFHGTTYFPVTGPPPGPLPASQPVPAPQASPQYTWTYSPAARNMHYSPYSPESVIFRSPYYETRPALPSASAIPRVVAPVYDDMHNISGMRPSVQGRDPLTAGESGGEIAEATYGEAQSTEEFPYQFPARQRSGHARRISVTLKSKEDTDALGLTTNTTTRREPWMVHSHRDAPNHRSWPWAPDFNAQTPAEI